MTSLNKLFSRYFIITIAVVLAIITIASNLGASVFFKNFIERKNEEENGGIVESVQEMLDNKSISETSYPFLLALISRQEQVRLILYENDEVLTDTFTGVLRPMMGMAARVPDSTYLQQDSHEVEYSKYNIEGYTLWIGRAKNPLVDIINADFIKTLNTLYIIMFFAALAIASFSAYILSRKFNGPIMQLKDNVNHISMNRFQSLKKCDTKARELKELSEDIENLAVQMQKEENMRRRLSNDIVHELKTPIAVLSTNIEAIMDGIYTADEERMSVLLGQINRITRLVNNLSDLTMLETEYNGMTRDRVDISEILESLHMVYLPAAADKGISLDKDIEKGLVMEGSEDRLLQVFVNLLSNSIKYTEKDGRILIRAYSSDGSIVCEVSDNGIGIDEKDKPFIFNRFYRGDESRSRETGGSGIGLAIVRAIVSAHGGEIKLDSKKGEGTKISVIFKKINIKNS
ncbi:MAG: HAMP domain-containing histidine kinase [Clostridia bacterium]|nr:HAMP domain-containing histidine kinase [Clostridia bacterium]